MSGAPTGSTDGSRGPGRSEGVSRRRFLSQAAVGGLVVAGGAGLLDACGSSGSSRGTGSVSVNAVSTSPPVMGGKLIIGTEAEVNGIDPTFDDFDSTGVMYARSFYDPLAATDANGNTVPYLAQSITHNVDYTVWTIQARPGVAFHDGLPFNADAMVANFNAQLKSFVSGSALTSVTAVTKLDDMTVSLTMSSPWVPFDTYLCGWIGGQFAYMASPAAIGAGTLAKHPVGTGPFVFQEWEPNDHLTATKNPHYWRSGMPYVDSIEFRPITDVQSRANSLRAGTIDIMHGTDPTTYLSLESAPGISIVSNLKGEFGEPDMDFIMLNTTKPPLDDLRVRQALACAIDLDAYNKFANNGLLAIDRSAFQKGSPYFSDVGYPTLDLAKANALIAQYKASTGNPVTLHLGNTATPGNEINMQGIASMWQKIGVTVTQDPIQQASYISNALVGDYSAYFWRQFGCTDPDQNYLWWNSATVKANGSISLNMARNSDPQIDAALQSGRTAVDPVARNEAYKTVATRLNADLPYLWQDRALWMVAAGPTVRNFNTYTLPNGSPGLGMKCGMFPVVNTWLER